MDKKTQRTNVALSGGGRFVVLILRSIECFPSEAKSFFRHIQDLTRFMVAKDCVRFMVLVGRRSQSAGGKEGHDSSRDSIQWAILSGERREFDAIANGVRRCSS